MLLGTGSEVRDVRLIRDIYLIASIQNGPSCALGMRTGRRQRGDPEGECLRLSNGEVPRSLRGSFGYGRCHGLYNGLG
jgi:hypothetical protein